MTANQMNEIKERAANGQSIGSDEVLAIFDEVKNLTDCLSKIKQITNGDIGYYKHFNQDGYTVMAKPHLCYMENLELADVENVVMVGWSFPPSTLPIERKEKENA